MRQIRTFSDRRLDNICTYCGNISETKDHVPSRILLDSPFPENLPVVSCCLSCNQSFSLDEEYFACSIECILHSTTDIEKLKREKIKSTLSKKGKLKETIEKSFILIENRTLFKYDIERFKNVIIKLAKGHAKYENSENIFTEPSSINFMPLETMSDNEIDAFYSNSALDYAPEIGSRGLQQFFINENNEIFNLWLTVQEGVYCYCVVANLGVLTVKIVIWDYLAIEVIWE